VPDGRRMISCAVLDGRRNAPAVPGAGCCGWNVVVFRDGFAFGRGGAKEWTFNQTMGGLSQKHGLRFRGSMGAVVGFWVGLRVEWCEDGDGGKVTGLGSKHAWVRVKGGGALQLHVELDPSIIKGGLATATVLQRSQGT
jgi:hypothetical protein